MVLLLRIIARSPVYREMRSKIRSQPPDDVWYDENVGWIIAYGLESESSEDLVLFTVSQPHDEIPGKLLRVLMVRHMQGEVDVQTLYSVTGEESVRRPESGGYS